MLQTGPESVLYEPIWTDKPLDKVGLAAHEAILSCNQKKHPKE